MGTTEQNVGKAKPKPFSLMSFLQIESPLNRPINQAPECTEKPICAIETVLIAARDACDIFTSKQNVQGISHYSIGNTLLDF